MPIFTTAGARLAITALVTPPAAQTAVAYAALTYTEIGSIEDLGVFGDKSEVITFDDIANRRTQKLKGQRNAGDLTVVLGLDDADPGQVLLRAAEADNSVANYHFRVTYSNRRTSGGADAIRYFSGKVMSVEETLGSANNVSKLTATIGIDSSIVSVIST